MAVYFDSSSDNEGMVCIAIKDESKDEDNKMKLISHVNVNVKFCTLVQNLT